MTGVQLRRLGGPVFAAVSVVLAGLACPGPDAEPPQSTTDRIAAIASTQACDSARAARIALESGDTPVEVVARSTGFGTVETMRRAFHRRC